MPSFFWLVRLNFSPQTQTRMRVYAYSPAYACVCRHSLTQSLTHIPPLTHTYNYNYTQLQLRLQKKAHA
jgi:hypothetical protein